MDTITDIIVRISKLTVKEKQHILNILLSDKIEFTKNANGYFFSLLHTHQDVIDKICECLVLMEKNRDIVRDMDNRRDQLLLYYNGLFEEKLKMTLFTQNENYRKKIELVPHSTSISIGYKRVYKYQKTSTSKDIDPDELIKEYIRNKKYHKDSIYSKILSKLKSNKFKSNMKTTEQSYEIDDLTNIESKSIEDVVAEIDTEFIEPEVEEVSEHHFDLDISDVEKYDSASESDLLDKIMDSDVEDTYSEHSDSSTDFKQKQEEQKHEEQLQVINYYKRLLTEQGYMFDEDNACKLIVEPYIML